MPIIQLKMIKGRTEQQKQDFVEKVTALTAETFAVQPGAVTVVIEEYDKENWASGGKLYSR
ncbi:MAG: 2-hydroxymuconate tautomerase family protein [Clostridiales bacterium]|jgi:4-oxalocrotonate tautomerase|nr:2-hydroxymuconate tautomerase family protein [Clostridiales bacterium]